MTAPPRKQLWKLQAEHDDLLLAFSQLETAFLDLKAMHDQLLSDLRRTAQRQPQRQPFTASIFGTNFNVR
jgi:predicted  nucleic acid-binding Zn-ribbon protein